MNKVKVEVSLNKHLVQRIHNMMSTTHKNYDFDSILNTVLDKALPEGTRKRVLSVQLNKGVYEDLKEHSEDNNISIVGLLKTLIIEELEGDEEEC